MSTKRRGSKTGKAVTYEEAQERGEKNRTRRKKYKDAKSEAERRAREAVKEMDAAFNRRGKK